MQSQKNPRRRENFSAFLHKDRFIDHYERFVFTESLTWSTSRGEVKIAAVRANSLSSGFFRQY